MMMMEQSFAGSCRLQLCAKILCRPLAAETGFSGPADRCLLPTLRPLSNNHAVGSRTYVLRISIPQCPDILSANIFVARLQYVCRRLLLRTVNLNQRLHGLEVVCRGKGSV